MEMTENKAQYDHLHVWDLDMTEAERVEKEIRGLTAKLRWDHLSNRADVEARIAFLREKLADLINQ